MKIRLETTLKIAAKSMIIISFFCLLPAIKIALEKLLKNMATKAKIKILRTKPDSKKPAPPIRLIILSERNIVPMTKGIVRIQKTLKVLSEISLKRDLSEKILRDMIGKISPIIMVGKKVMFSIIL